MRRVGVWIRWSTAAFLGLVILAVVGLAFLLERSLAQFGMTPHEAYQVLRAEQSHAEAIRDAEGPIDTPDGIAERGFVPIGGIKQWVTIRGEDRRNPAILILHGGPGDPDSQLAYFFRHWERAFTVVQWDQRGAGRTYGLYGKATPVMTLDQFIQDGADVADYARARLHQPKIILLGHSWGSAFGVYLIKHSPSLFCAFVGTGQIVHTADLEPRYYAYALAHVIAHHDNAGLAELRRVGPPPYRSGAQEELVRSWLDRYLDDPDKRFLLAAVSVALRNSRYSAKDFSQWQAGHLSFSLPVMGRTYDAIDLDSLGDNMPVPFFIIDGRSDPLAPPDLAARYYRAIRAPEKRMFLIDGGHFAFMSNSDAFLRILIQHVRPLCIPPQSPPAA
ncbi:MAG: alpha/beta fold hydrolase [Steroidobacteraceae bacterium]